MSTIIYEWENGNAEEWVYVDDDGSVVHHRENAGWVMARKGINARETRYTTEEAKAKRPGYADKIEEAIKAIKK